MITILSRFKAADAQASEKLRRLLLKLKEQAPSEPGYVRYELFATAEDPVVFYSKDSWANSFAVDEHVRHLMDSGYYDQGVALLAEPMTAVTLTEL